VVRGRLWRRSDPALPNDERDRLVRMLMRARRDIARARASGDRALATRARARVQSAKVALGERGPVWWGDGAPDLTRHLARTTPYREWYEALLMEGATSRRGRRGRRAARVPGE
jgi:hypothetical protein